MNAVKVKREDLLTKVRANREAHRELFLKAQTNYRRFIIEELDRMLGDAKIGRKIRRSIDLVEPRDHTSDYDRTIMMLEMSVDDTIILDATEFDQYVRDVWAWSQYDGVTLGEYAVGAPVYRKPKRNWEDEEEED
ncbi:MAG: hypothetical protein DME55_07785 [Verrucomicrobia bacterium]|nr:MAG: hypothetical protein DME55_07785 [Verrucomicrobiota bacterium]